MRTLQGRFQELATKGTANMDGFTPDECIRLAKKASETLGKKFIFDGRENIIKEQ